MGENTSKSATKTFPPLEGAMSEISVAGAYENSGTFATGAEAVATALTGAAIWGGPLGGGTPVGGRESGMAVTTPGTFADGRAL
jgi:hypothetical protein